MLSIKNYIPNTLKTYLRKMFPKKVEPKKELIFIDLKIRKEIKRKKIFKLLRCPHCGHDILSKPTRCKNCLGKYPCTANKTLDFLSKEMKILGGVFDTENISTQTYTGKCQDLIDDANGLVLDAGAGFNTVYHDKVVNLEIVDYPTTDVLGICERLPFKDNSFAGVISIAVLEHVKDPFAMSRELLRVLKPGGFFFFNVPFLQPYHAYPDHFYNMSLSGLKNLFKGHVDIMETISHNPTELLPWYFDELLKGIPKNQWNKVKRLTIKDLMEGAKIQKFFKMMSSESKEILAHSNTIIGKKN